MRVPLLVILVCCTSEAIPQKADQLVRKGNDAYRKKEFKAAEKQYQSAIQQQPANATALFNAGNAAHQLKNYAQAEQSFAAVANSSSDAGIRAQAFYNMALAQLRQQKLDEAINSLKQSLRLNPADNDARDNLQKALKEKKAQQQKQQQNSDQNKKQQKKPQKDKKQPLSPQQAEAMLNKLMKDEKNLQRELNKKNPSGRALKDW